MIAKKLHEIKRTKKHDSLLRLALFLRQIPSKDGENGEIFKVASIIPKSSVYHGNKNPSCVVRKRSPASLGGKRERAAGAAGRNPRKFGGIDD